MQFSLSLKAVKGCKSIQLLQLGNMNYIKLKSRGWWMYMAATAKGSTPGPSYSSSQCSQLQRQGLTLWTWLLQKQQYLSKGTIHTTLSTCEYCNTHNTYTITHVHTYIHITARCMHKLLQYADLSVCKLL